MNSAQGPAALLLHGLHSSSHFPAADLSKCSTERLACSKASANCFPASLILTIELFVWSKFKACTSSAKQSPSSGKQSALRAAPNEAIRRNDMVTRMSTMMLGADPRKQAELCAVASCEGVK